MQENLYSGNAEEMHYENAEEIHYENAEKCIVKLLERNVRSNIRK